MICPYCSADMEPLELNGKTFCSNCGMTISQNQAQAVVQERPKIQQFTGSNQVPQTSNDQLSQPVPNQPQVAPISDITPNSVRTETLKDLGLEATTEPVISKIEEIPQPQPVKVKVDTIKDSYKISDLATDDTKLTPPKEHLEELSLPPVDTSEEPQKDQSENTANTASDRREKLLSDIFHSDANEDNDIRVLSEDELKPLPNEDISKSVKDIDTLGASGILLDILNDDAISKERNTQKDALEAASEIVENIQVVEDPQKSEEESTKTDNKKPKGSNKDDTKKEEETDETSKEESGQDLLNEETSKSEAPIETPTASTEEADDIDIDTEIALEQEVEPENDTAEKIIPEIPKNTLEELENIADETSEIPETISEPEALASADKAVEDQNSQDTKKDEILGSLFTGPVANNEDFIKSIPKIKQTKLEKKEIKEELDKIKNDQNEVVTQVEESLETEETKEDKAEKKKDKKKKEDNSSHLKNYFSQMVGTDSKEKKNRERKNKLKKLRRTLFIVLGILILAFAVSAGVFYVYFSRTPEVAVQKSTSTADFNINLPKEMVYGYEPTGNTIFSKETETFYLIYAFKGDVKRKITFYQTKTDKPDKIIDDFKNEIKGTFQIETHNNVEYTIFENGSIIWHKDGFVYKLKVEGETYKDLILKMAESVE